jgi:hypothetical protein
VKNMAYLACAENGEPIRQHTLHLRGFFEAAI